MTYQKEQPMNSERKAFEEYWYENNLPYEGDDELKDCAWLAWEASAQRQGYKLVPVDTYCKLDNDGNIITNP